VKRERKDTNQKGGEERMRTVFLAVVMLVSTCILTAYAEDMITVGNTTIHTADAMTHVHKMQGGSKLELVSHNGGVDLIYLTCSSSNFEMVTLRFKDDNTLDTWDDVYCTFTGTGDQFKATVQCDKADKTNNYKLLGNPCEHWQAF